MRLARALAKIENIMDDLTTEHAGGMVRRMVELIQIHGKLPVSAEVQDCIQKALNDGGAGEVISLLGRDVIVATRMLLHASDAQHGGVNTVTRIEDIPGALGLNSLPEKFSEIGKVNRIKNAFRGRGIAITAYTNAILRAQIASRLIAQITRQETPSSQALTVALLAELPIVLLAYTHPHIYAACWIDADQRELPTLERPFKTLMKGGTQACFERIAVEAGFPQEMIDYVALADIAPWNRRTWPVESSDENMGIAHASFISARLQHGLTRFLDRQDYLELTSTFKGKGGLTSKNLKAAYENLSSDYIRSVTQIGLPAFRLPDHLEEYEEVDVDADGNREELFLEWTHISNSFDPFIFELKACLNAPAEEGGFSRLPQALLCTAFALLRCIGFDRVTFLNINRHDGGLMLKPVLIMGRKVKYSVLLQRRLDSLDEYAPDKAAYEDQQAIFYGDPINGEDWPFVAFPMIQGEQVMGIVYADKRKVGEGIPLTTDEQMAATALAEVWQNVPASFP